MLFTTCYLPPVSYLKKLTSCSSVILDGEEHFVKQTIRNRCHILSPNGTQVLIIPVVHQNRNRTAIKDIRISNDIPWQRQHWRSFVAAYQRSAFFEFYEDDLNPFYFKPYKFLFDFNTELLKLVLTWINQPIDINFTDKYLKESDNIPDFRNLSNTGNPQISESEKTYPQVFTNKNTFTYGLSSIDLVFNNGPNAMAYLQPTSE